MLDAHLPAPVRRWDRAQRQKLAKFEPRLAPSIRARLRASVDPFDMPLAAEVFAHLPPQIAAKLIAEWEERLATEGRTAANRYLWELREDLLPELFPSNGLPFHATDDEIAETAMRAARLVRSRYRPDMGETELLVTLAGIARRFRVQLPPRTRVAQIRARMLEPAWWRRALRKRFQTVEHAAIKAGCVHRRAAPYVSDEAMRRHERHARRTAVTLEALEAINESTGEVLALDELARRSLANPANRRAAMMVCVRGLQDHAQERGFVGVFLTLTCPSRMHPRASQSGERNPNYDGTSPRAAQTYLARKVWNHATRKLGHQCIEPGRNYFGLRIVEPHHDGTPHWHLLAFVDPAHEATFLDTLRDYALRDAGQEPGAQAHRFTVERIDPSKGDAAAYVAKYIAKGIGAFGVGGDLEIRARATSSAARIVAYAIWGIRQFQFFGVGAITHYRELYRLDRLPGAVEASVGALWIAARESDYARFLSARNAHNVRLATLREPEPSRRYPGELVQRLRGIVVHCEAGVFPVVTRTDDWSIRLRPSADRSPLGPVSITPRDVVLTEFFKPSDNVPSNRKALCHRHPEHGATAQARQARAGPQPGGVQ